MVKSTSSRKYSITNNKTMSSMYSMSPGDKQKFMDSAENVVFTGKIDEFFNYEFGRLEYRSLNFINEVLDSPNYQGNAVVNYTEAEIPFTRIIEHKHFNFKNQNYVFK